MLLTIYKVNPRHKLTVIFLSYFIGHSGLVVSVLDCGVRGPRVRISLQAVVFIMTAGAIYSLEHGLCTFTAVPRSTQPSPSMGQ